MTTNERERLLCYAAGMIGSILANPNNTYSAEQLMPSCIRNANRMIEVIYNDKALKEILEERQYG